MRKLALRLFGIALLVFGVAVTFGQSAGTATWSWTAPTTYTNGQPLSPSDAAGMTYNLYTGPGKGHESSTPVSGITALSYMTSGYASGSTVCGYLTAELADGATSAPTNEVCKTFTVAAPLVPAAPSNATVQ